MFNVFKKVLNGKPIDEFDAKKVSPFVLLRWLSGDPRLMPLATQLNQHNIDTLTLLKAIQHSLKGKIKFIQYPSSKKEDVYVDERVKAISTYFNCGAKESYEFYEFMMLRCPEEIDDFMSIFKKKDIQELKEMPEYKEFFNEF